MKKVLVLDNIRSVYNVGSMFRTANACAIDEIILSGITPTPLDNKGRPRSDFAKVALGAEKIANWRHVEEIGQVMEELKQGGYFSIAIEQSERAVDYKTISLEGREKVAFIVGSEVDGIQHNVLEKASVIAEIPMLGTKESLNVTIALGIALYRILGI